MLQWRELRKSHPEMFRQGVQVWQSPTAYVDGVLWAWQQDEEASKFEPLLRLVDALSTHWSEAAGERGFMLQQVQASIPAGCTPVLQVTDTAMAQPAKSAAKAEHARQKRLFLLKAGQEKVRPSFKYGAREMFQVAIVMHKKMEALATERNTVLSEARACGWLHWRPGPSGLELASEQEWAKSLTESTHKIAPEVRARRGEGVVLGRPTFDYSKDQIAPERLENCYFNEEDLVLEADQGLLDPVAQRRLEALFLHPSVRSEVEKELAELSLVTSQRPTRKVKEGEAKKPKTSRAEKAASWRVALGKKTIASRLAQLVPYSKEKAQKVKKSFVEKMAKKLKDKSKEKALKDKKLSLAIADKPAEEEAEQPQPLPDVVPAVVPKAAAKTKPAKSSEDLLFEKEWKDVKVRVLDRSSTLLWRDANGKVVKADASKQLCLVSLQGAPSVTRWCSSEVLYKVTGEEKKAMKLQVDRRNFKKEEKAALVEALGGEPKFAISGADVEHPELLAWWHMLLKARQQAEDTESSRKAAVYLDPGVAQVYLKESAPDGASHLAEASLAQWGVELQGKPGLIVLPVHGGGHWSMLVWAREGDQYLCRYYDSLKGGGSACREAAKKLVTPVTRLLILSPVSGEVELPETRCPVAQLDGWSCGYHIMTVMEEEMRQHRGEGRQMIIRHVDATRKVLNHWLDGLIKWRRSEAAGVCPPPLPPPAKLEPEEAVVPVPEPIASTQPPRASGASGDWGCPRCRWSTRGCLMCCPEKSLRYSNRKLAEAEQKTQQDEAASAKVEAAKTAAAEKKDLQDQEKKAAEAEKLAKQDEAALASVEALKADEAEKMGEQDEAAMASEEPPKSMTMLD